METSWKISLLANSTAIAVSALLGIWYSQRQRNNSKDKDQTISGWGYVGVLLLVGMGAFLSYLLAYILFGYVPMSRISKGLINTT
jgi:hypothetical protein